MNLAQLVACPAKAACSAAFLHPENHTAAFSPSPDSPLFLSLIITHGQSVEHRSARAARGSWPKATRRALLAGQERHHQSMFHGSGISKTSAFDFCMDIHKYGMDEDHSDSPR